MIKILTVFGTRSELIKLSPVIKEIGKHSDTISNKICNAAQQRDLIEPLLKHFSIKADYDMNIMSEYKTLEELTSIVLLNLKDILLTENPDYVLVLGDSSSAMAAALAAYFYKIKVAHIESGLRTNNKYSPFPEEINRKIIDVVADLYFVHTNNAKENLLREGIKEDRIEVTGNTGLDALLDTNNKANNFINEKLNLIPFYNRRIILVTAHRRESYGQPLLNICNALKDIALKYANHVHIVIPVNSNPEVKETVFSNLGNINNISLIDPLEYPDFVFLMRNSFIILSDSGGIQEEAPSLNKPVLVMRNETERQEALVSGATLLVGTSKERIVEQTTKLIEDKSHYEFMSKALNPYGDGKAASRIVSRLIKDVQ
ncbi:MAG: UDP-N-acetylglucosamine 2-epimerase [Omnitrophica WOR_2 bacterium GWF2_38_59]|nr:MAG: UDP-N-acetylglucosamine 2-epimerase [Omnitrophica WOR_2 bacterium GWF2_38_59]OGX53526.1 MAG: UDP-N-acetylglucosamine 2-epimerase [Omnitrophica WOR_2 bacterium RIFOXYA12_FULL_38_10]OGX55274.1 MAG: UDP-N-acetylglucosamine 2-epimerase [Omnitrophica WOR_2 bacterium RIFOXYC2_FULL_38_12]